MIGFVVVGMLPVIRMLGWMLRRLAVVLRTGTRMRRCIGLVYRRMWLPAMCRCRAGLRGRVMRRVLPIPGRGHMPCRTLRRLSSGLRTRMRAVR